DAVRREVREEVGVAVDGLRYVASQPWPFPHSLMLGFAARYAGGEIVCDGRHIKVTVNDQVTVDGNLDDVKDPEVLKAHPGIQRTRGHVGFLGHGAHVEFRNIRIKELP
ncbi:MAG TPA: DUF1080 domain-containing protein, partial [Pirellulales bacterium]|nr:DUF1080 domain-containing protein [Pirellulales bacterium]